MLRPGLSVCFLLLVYLFGANAYRPLLQKPVPNCVRVPSLNICRAHSPGSLQRSVVLQHSPSIIQEQGIVSKKKNANPWNPLRSLQKGQKGVTTFFETQLPMLQYLWPKDNIRLRVYLVASMFFMFTGKWFNTRVPFMLQKAIDSIPGTIQAGGAVKGAGMSVAMAVLFYGLSRATAVFCEELKTCLFTNVSQNVLRKFAHQIFTHLHTLGADFHLQTPSGVISVAYVRAVRGFQALMFQLVFSVAPMALELAMVARIMYKRFSPTFSAITLATFTSYLIFTIYVTQWRVRLRKEIVEVDNARNGFFIDSLLNHEVVKLFNNEKRETKRFDSYLERMQKLNIDSTYAVAALNVGQAVLFCAGLTASLLVALGRVQRGVMSVGDVVAVNAMLLQLAIPFDFIGYTYQELRQSLVDMGYMTQVLNNFAPSVPDPAYAVPIEQHTRLHAASSSSLLSPQTQQQPLQPSSAAREDTVSAPTASAAGRKYQYFATPEDVTGTAASTLGNTEPLPPSTLEFKNVVFSYKKLAERADVSTQPASDASDEALLKGISFRINAGESVAIVGPSGSGKSTVIKLITRMLDVDSGDILLDGANIAHVTKESIRRRVAVVPQDTCLFDETVGYNIKYGNPEATDEEVREVVQLANLQDTVRKLPQGLDTVVGERGGRLSGGERQKVSIARALLRRPSLLLCDEVTSSVDALAERDIIDALRMGSGARSGGSAGSALRGDSAVECEASGGQIPVHRHRGALCEEDSAVADEDQEVQDHGVAAQARTTITVAHRLSSIVHCDRILVLQRGRVVEQGTHRELLAVLEGVYRHMWEVQNNVDGAVARGSGGSGVGEDIISDLQYGNASCPSRQRASL